MSAALPDEVREEIESALDEFGLGPRQLTPISPLHGRKVPVSPGRGLKQARYTLLAEAEDGRRVKARHLADPAAAESLSALRIGLEPAFAPVLTRHGAILVEEWIEGVDLADADADERAAEAGALLGRLHTSPIAGREPRRQSTERYAERARAELEALTGDARLSAAEGESLSGELESLDPGEFDAALVHRDFCGENFVIDRGGRLVVIDNEWFEVGAPGFDLARTYHRWPLPDETWGRFSAAHSAVAGPVGSLPFWMVSTALFGAGVFHRLRDPRLDPLLVLLRALGAGDRPYEPA